MLLLNGGIDFWALPVSKCVSPYVRSSCGHFHFPAICLEWQRQFSTRFWKKVILDFDQNTFTAGEDAIDSRLLGNWGCWSHSLASWRYHALCCHQFSWPCCFVKLLSRFSFPSFPLTREEVSNRYSHGNLCGWLWQLAGYEFTFWLIKMNLFIHCIHGHSHLHSLYWNTFPTVSTQLARCMRRLNSHWIS